MHFSALTPFSIVRLFDQSPAWPSLSVSISCSTALESESQTSQAGLPDGSMWNHFRQKWCWKKHVVLVVPKWFHRIFVQILMFVVNSITLIGLFIHESQFLCSVLRARLMSDSSQGVPWLGK